MAETNIIIKKIVFFEKFAKQWQIVRDPQISSKWLYNSKYGLLNQFLHIFF